MNSSNQRSSMTPMRWRQIQSVFEAALKLRLKDRVAYIRLARASDDYADASSSMAIRHGTRPGLACHQREIFLLA